VSSQIRSAFWFYRNLVRFRCFPGVSRRILSPMVMCIPSVAAVVGVPVFSRINLASLAGLFMIIRMPKWVSTAISGLVSSIIFMASSVVMCPFHGLFDGLSTQRMRMRVPVYGLLRFWKYSVSEV
jgi:hypothetical protein